MFGIYENTYENCVLCSVCATKLGLPWVSLADDNACCDRCNEEGN